MMLFLTVGHSQEEHNFLIDFGDWQGMLFLGMLVPLILIVYSPCREQHSNDYVKLHHNLTYQTDRSDSQYTLLKKKRTFNSSIFSDDPGSGSVTLGHAQLFKVFAKQLKSHYSQDKFGNCLNVAFLFGNSVCDWNLGSFFITTTVG